MRFISRVPLLITIFVSTNAIAMPSFHETLSTRSGQLTVHETRFIRGGCTAGLDKVCKRTRKGRTVCRCQS